MINWISLTPDEARGLITTLDIAYKPVLDTASSGDCSEVEFMESETTLMNENLFEQSSANITGLEPNREYCVAIRVSTDGGDSGFSNSIKLLRKSKLVEESSLASTLSIFSQKNDPS